MSDVINVALHPLMKRVWMYVALPSSRKDSSDLLVGSPIEWPEKQGV